MCVGIVLFQENGRKFKNGTRVLAPSISSDRGERSIRSILINIPSDIKSKACLLIQQENLRIIFDRFITIQFDRIDFRLLPQYV